MKRVVASVRRAGGVSLAALVLVAATPAAALASYWDYQGTLHDDPTPPYQFGELNPEFAPPTGGWGIRLSRSNCQAKMILRYRETLNYLTYSIPGGCSTNDYKHCYSAQLHDASISWNTDTGPGDVWVNVRVDQILDDEGRCA